MARGSQGKGKTPRTETSSAPSPSDITMPILSSTDPISQDFANTGSRSSELVALEPPRLDTLDSSALARPKNMKSGFSDSQGAQDLAISSLLDGEKPSAQAADDRQFSPRSKKRSKRKANKTNAQGQGSQVPAISPNGLPLDYCGPMTAPPIASPKLNVGSSSVSPRLAFAEPTKTEESLRQENEKLGQELEEASGLAKGLKESHVRLEEEVEAWRQKCKGFSEVVKELKTEVEKMINFRISKFFEIMEEEKERGGKEQEDKGKEVEGEKVEEKEVEETESKEREGKEKGREEKKRRNKGGKEKEGKGKKRKLGDRKEGKGKAEDLELKARQVKCQKSYFDQMQDYRRRKKAEERRRKRWWNRFQRKVPRTSWRRVSITLFLLGLLIILASPLVVIGTAEIRAYNGAHARRIARLKLTESRNVRLAKAVARFVADLMPEPIRGFMYHRFLNDGWNLEELHW